MTASSPAPTPNDHRDGGPVTPEKTLPEFAPTLREVMLRPKWMGVLLLSLIVAGVFAWLGQWQLSQAIDTDPLPPGATETVEPLEEIVEPGEYLPEPYVGQRVETRGTWVPGDFLIVSTRFNDRVEGYWVTGQLRVDGHAEPTSIAVAVGFTDDRARAEQAVQTLNEQAAESTEPVEVTGRIISDEGAVLPPRGEPYRMDRMSPAMLLGQWHDTEGLSMYRPYLTSAVALAGLDPITSPAPELGGGVNWLNIFYAAEWIIFAGFAFYIWYRLGKDEWELEVEAFEDAQAEQPTV